MYYFIFPFLWVSLTEEKLIVWYKLLAELQTKVQIHTDNCWLNDKAYRHKTCCSKMVANRSLLLTEEQFIQKLFFSPCVDFEKDMTLTSACQPHCRAWCRLFFTTSISDVVQALVTNLCFPLSHTDSLSMYDMSSSPLGDYEVYLSGSVCVYVFKKNTLQYRLAFCSHIWNQLFKTEIMDSLTKEITLFLAKL